MVRLSEGVDKGFTNDFSVCTAERRTAGLTVGNVDGLRNGAVNGTAAGKTEDTVDGGTKSPANGSPEGMTDGLSDCIDVRTDVALGVSDETAVG